jgi:hypothetical protein
VLARWGWAATIVFVALGALSAAVVASSIWSGDYVQRAARKITVTTVAGATAGPGAAGLVAALGSTGLLIVVLLVVTTPALVTHVRARWFTPDNLSPRPEHRPAPAPEPPDSPVTGPPADETAPGPAGDAADEAANGSKAAGDEDSGKAMPELPEDLSGLDDWALCLAWRRSFGRLEAASTAAERLMVVEQRQGYLDELHRRAPDGVAAWLASGARAAGNPLPYVDENHTDAD